MLRVKLYPWQKNQNRQQGEQALQGLAGDPANTASAQEALVMELLRRRVVQRNPVQPPSPRPDDDIPEWGKGYYPDAPVYPDDSVYRSYLENRREQDVVANPSEGTLPRATQGQEAANTTTAQNSYRGAVQKPEPWQADWSKPQVAGQRVREFDGFAQGKEPARHYYVVGRRPLDSWDWVKKQFQTGSEPGPVEHRHLIGSNGNNFGTTDDGIFTEKAALFSQYVYIDQKKYDAECIEEAKLRLGKRFEQRVYDESTFGNLTNYSIKSGHRPRDMAYYFLQYNCQHYVDDVIREAERVAKERGISLLVR